MGNIIAKFRLKIFNDLDACKTVEEAVTIANNLKDREQECRDKIKALEINVQKLEEELIEQRSFKGVLANGQLITDKLVLHRFAYKSDGWEENGKWRLWYE